MINKRTISDNLRTLFSTLAKWTNLNATAGIALELGAKLPRDDDMHFPVQRCGCYWGSRFNHWTSGSSSRVLENRLSLENAPVIALLSIKKSFPSQLLVWPITKIIRSLPCIEQIACERRLEGDPRDLLQNPSANSYIIRSRYFTTASAIRSISLWVSPDQYLFQDLYDFFKIKAADRYTQLNIDATRASFDLEEMAISHALDARDFFHYFSSKFLLASASVSLERLALTCKVGKLSTEPAEVEQLLIAASKATTYMPRLRIMETWSPGLGKGFFFRYEVEKSQAKLTVAATWPLETLSAQVVDSWQEIASGQGDRRFLWSTDSINSGTLTREDSICKHLRLFPLLRDWENN